MASYSSGGKKSERLTHSKEGNGKKESGKHVSFITFHTNRVFEYNGPNIIPIGDRRPFFKSKSPSKEYFESRFQRFRASQSGGQTPRGKSPSSRSRSASPSSSSELDYEGDSGSNIKEPLISKEGPGPLDASGKIPQESEKDNNEPAKEKSTMKDSKGRNVLRRIFGKVAKN